MNWYVYMLCCNDGTIYTGMTDNIERRVAVHNSGGGAKYTRGRLPVKLIYTEQAVSRSAALTREAEIKRLRRSEKLELAEGNPSVRFDVSKGAAEIIGKLHAAGYEAYFVGGCVRDTLMGLRPRDWDIATSALPEETLSCLHEYRTIDTGIKHGTVTVLADSSCCEVTTFRCDGEYTDGRHPDSVKFISGIGEDMARRDFTVNAMAWSEKSGIIDIFGGRMDIKKGVIRCVGDPEERFKEDALRILRALRFASRYGFKIERAAEQAMHDCRDLLHNVSGERVREELLGILMGNDAGTQIIRFRDVFEVLIPGMVPAGYDQNNPWYTYDLLHHTAAVVDIAPRDVAVRLAALFHDIGKPLCLKMDEHGIAHYAGHAEMSAEICRHTLKDLLKFDNKTADESAELVRHHDDVTVPEIKSVRRRIAGMGIEMAYKLLDLQEADSRAQNPKLTVKKLEDIAAVRKMTKEIEHSESCFKIRDLAVTGRDLMELRIPEGPLVGKALDGLLNGVLDGKLHNVREELLDQVKKQQKPPAKKPERH